jgi:hypothetical protein
VLGMGTGGGVNAVLAPADRRWWPWISIPTGWRRLETTPRVMVSLIALRYATDPDLETSAGGVSGIT